MADLDQMQLDASFIKHDAFNAELDPVRLIQHFITPRQFLFARNHGKIPDIQAEHHKVHIDAHSNLGWHAVHPYTLSMNQLEAMTQTEVICALQCAGNRRSEMSGRKETEGLQWKGGAVGNVAWSGVLLRPLIQQLGVPDNWQDIPALVDAHIEFVCHQKCDFDVTYATSVPLSHVMDSELPVLLATHMNGHALTRPHGAPVRVVVPCHIGARSVKWCHQIILRADESPNFYQQKDYKVLPPQVGKAEKEQAMKVTPAMQAFGISSFIALPAPNTHHVDKQLVVKGYALSGTKSPIKKVEIALVHDDDRQDPVEIADQPTTIWVEATLTGSEHVFSWVLFEAELSLALQDGPFAVVSRAETKAGEKQIKRCTWQVFVSLIEKQTGINRETQESSRSLRNELACCSWSELFHFVILTGWA